MTLEALAQQGRRYVPATLAASVAGRIAGIRKELVKESFSLSGPEDHRLESVANIHGIEFINDSRACSVNSTWFALESMRKPVIWIAGGLDRVLDYSQLLSLVGLKVKGIIFLGEENRKLQKAFGATEIPVVPAADINEAVDLAYYMGKTGDVVLFSPGCPSADRFENFEERGNRFRMAVKNL
jgi:UDP-N-acetylmuramoylalanine--D-glutamate ligase